ncbi:MAG: NifB/NifX family molybdenum-iron cluster-binding protein [Bacteroidales bacterium]
MKVVITSSGNSSSSMIDKRFGRAAYFALFDSESGELKFIENSSRESVEGAGVASVQEVASLGANKIVAWEFGNKVKTLLSSMEIEMVTINEELSIEEIVEKLKSASL